MAGRVVSDVQMVDSHAIERKGLGSETQRINDRMPLHSPQPKLVNDPVIHPLPRRVVLKA